MTGDKAELTCSGDNVEIALRVETRAKHTIEAKPPGVSLDVHKTFLGMAAAEAHSGSAADRAIGPAGRGIDVDGYCDGQHIGGYWFY